MTKKSGEQESGGTPDLCLEFIELIQEARDHLKVLQSTSAKTTYRLVKFADALQTWMEMNDISTQQQRSIQWGGAGGPQRQPTLESGPTTNSAKPTSTNHTSPRTGRLAGASANENSADDGGPKRRNK